MSPPDSRVRAGFLNRLKAVPPLPGLAITVSGGDYIIKEGTGVRRVAAYTINVLSVCQGVALQAAVAFVSLARKAELI